MQIVFWLDSFGFVQIQEITLQGIEIVNAKDDTPEQKKTIFQKIPFKLKESSQQDFLESFKTDKLLLKKIANYEENKDSFIEHKNNLEALTYKAKETLLLREKLVFLTDQ